MYLSLALALLSLSNQILTAISHRKLVAISSSVHLLPLRLLPVLLLPLQLLIPIKSELLSGPTKLR